MHHTATAVIQSLSMYLSITMVMAVVALAIAVTVATDEPMATVMATDVDMVDMAMDTVVTAAMDTVVTLTIEAIVPMVATVAMVPAVMATGITVDMATLLDILVVTTEGMAGTATTGDTLLMAAITEDMHTMVLMGPTTAASKPTCSMTLTITIVGRQAATQQQTAHQEAGVRQESQWILTELVAPLFWSTFKECVVMVQTIPWILIKIAVPRLARQVRDLIFVVPL